MAYNDDEQDRERRSGSRDRGEDRPRRKFLRRRRKEGDDADEPALGGWRPIGEALFWGVIFLSLTIVAFALSGGSGRIAAGPEPEPGKQTESPLVPAPLPGSTVAKTSANGPVQATPKQKLPGDFDESLRPNANLTKRNDPPAPPLVAPSSQRQRFEEAAKNTALPRRDLPPAGLPEGPFLKDLAAEDQGLLERLRGPAPWKNLRVGELYRLARVAPPAAALPAESTLRTPIAALLRAATLTAADRRVDMAPMLKLAELRPARRRTDIAALQRAARLVHEAPPQRTDIKGMWRTARLEAPPRRTEIAPLLRTATVTAPPTRWDWRPQLRLATFQPLPPAWEVAQLFKPARLLAPERRTDVASMYKPARVESRQQRLPWEEMLHRAWLDPDYRRTDVAFLARPARFVPSTFRRDLPGMVKNATVEPTPRVTPVARLTKNVRLIPLPKPEPIAATVGAVAAPLPERAVQTLPLAAPAEPQALLLRSAPRTARLGKRLVLVARVVGRDQQALPDQLVEWTIDRNGVGRIAATPQDARLAKPSEKPLPTFARTWTATAPHRVPADLGDLEIQPGETWIAVETESAGTMLAVAEAPRVAAPTAGRASARVHWDHAGAKFPGTLRAQAGGTAALASRVGIGADAGAPGEALPNYRVRYTLTDPHGAAFENGQTTFEADSAADGQAPAGLRQAAPQVGATRGKAELLGRNPLSGEPATILAAGEFTVEWLAPQIVLQPRGPSVAPAGEPAAIKVAGSVAEPQFAKGLRLWALPAADLRLQGGDRGQPLDLGDFPAVDGRAPEALARLDQAGLRTVRFEVRAGQHVWTTAAHEINFAAPELAVAVEAPERWLDGDSKPMTVKATNKGLVPARNLRARLEVPVGWHFESVEDGGAENGAAVWLLDRLDPGASKTFRLRARANGEGKGVARATAEALAASPVSAETALAAGTGGVPNLQLEVRDTVDPVKLGEEFEYVVTLRNSGAVAARDVRLEGALPSGFAAVSATGNLPFRVEDGKLVLGAATEIPAGGRLEGRIRAKATVGGKVVFALQVRHASLGAAPARSEESTVAYRP